jgi:hypothetical protein
MNARIRTNLLLLSLAAAALWGGVAHAQTATTLLRSGPSSAKRNLVIIGDGFQAGAGQQAFDDYVIDEVLNGVFAEGPLWESMQAFNIFRVNVSSVDAGVTQVDSKGKVTTARNTALHYRFSGDWNRCWMEGASDTQSLIDGAIDAAGVSADYVFVVLNEPGFGGCRGGAQLAVTLGAPWTVGAHEMGHMVGDLCDEYTGGSSPTMYTGGEPGCVNLTIDIDRDRLKWSQWVDPLTALATTFDASTMDGAETAGAFVGGTLGQNGYNAGIWRPAFNDRMKSNSPNFGSVNYHQMKSSLDPTHDHDFRESYVGDFNGDGLDDLVVHNANSLELYLSNGTHLVPTWVATLPIPSWDTFLEHDRFFVGDFDGDGKDDLFVFNAVDWAIPYFGMLRSNGAGFDMVARFDQQLPGWDDMRANDTFFVGDFDGDGKADVYVFNGEDWAVGYLGMLRSSGNGLTMVSRYDDVLPGWDSMKAHDRFYVADVDGDGRKDLYVFNGVDWSMSYLEVMHSTGTSLDVVERNDGDLGYWGAMLDHDQFFVADFDGDGDEDLYVFNGDQWSIPYLGALEARNGGHLSCTGRWDGWVDGWAELAPHDTFYVGDINGDGRKDLYVYNGVDWGPKYLGVIDASPGPALLGGWQQDWIDGWHLGSGDKLYVGNFSGGRRGWRYIGGVGGIFDNRLNDVGGAIFSRGQDDVVISNESAGGVDWLGILRSYSRSVGQSAIYMSWIHHHRYQRDGIW